MFPRVTLKEGKERKVLNFHPWVYRDEIAALDRAAERIGPPGGIVELTDAGGKAVAKAWLTPRVRLAARVLTRELGEDLDEAFFRRRIERALARRASLAGAEARRVLHAEADELPGIVVDQYGGVLVLQLRYAGAEALRAPLLAALRGALAPRGIFERSDMEGRKDEGLEPRAGLIEGEVPAEVEFKEGPARFRALVQRGHKTGFYLDQRENRALVASLVKPGSRVLDGFASTGAFAVRAALAGAAVVAVEKDPEAAAAIRVHAALNGVAVETRVADCFEALPALKDERFDLVVLDPPALAKKREELGTARWAFVTLSSAALRLLGPGGRLFVSSCAYHLSAELLEEALRIAGGESGKRLRILAETFQPPDHPWIVQVPETLYLKSLLVEVE